MKSILFIKDQGARRCGRVKYLYFGLTVFSLAFLFPNLMKAAAPTPVPAPAITFESLEYDGGNAWEGEPVSHIYKFKNTGSAVLHINRVRTSCGCTAALVSQKEIKPGESGEIKATFNTKRYRGHQKKSIYVSSDDPKHSNLRLQLAVTVLTAAHLSPRSVNFREVTRGGEASQTVQVIPDVTDLKITGVSASPDLFQAKIVSQPGGKDKEPGKIEITLNPQASVGRHSGSLIVKTDHPRAPQLTARLYARISGKLQYSPRMLLLTRPEESKEIKLTYRGKNELQVSSLESTLPQVKVELQPVNPPQEYKINVLLQPDKKTEDQRGFIIMTTKLEGEETIKIPVMIRVPTPKK